MNARVITSEELASAGNFRDFMPAYKVDANTVVKTGDSVRLAEVAAMNLVREKTSIPVPEVYNAYTDPATGHVRIVMEFIEGDCLADVWDTFSTEQKQQVTEQLRDFLSQLHDIRESFVGSVDGTACADPLFDEDIGAYGPYKDEASFNEGIITALKNTMTNGWGATWLLL